MTNIHPLASLGKTRKDYGIMRKYLRVPWPYLVYIFSTYKNFDAVPMKMSEVVRETHRWIMTEDTAKDIMKDRHRASGVPAYLCGEIGQLPKCPANVLSLYSDMIGHADKVGKLGAVLYMHSEFENQAIYAASNIVKAVIGAGEGAAMVDFPSFMDERRDFGDRSTRLMEKASKVDVLCLYLIGTEYVANTGFTEAHLQQLIRKRKVNGKTTILVSHLSPAQFAERYHTNLKTFDAVELKFTDASVASTIESLKKALKG